MAPIRRHGSKAEPETARRPPRRRAPRVEQQNPAATATEARPEPLLEYPQAGEVIGSSNYSFRIRTLPLASSVEVRVGQGDWQPARFAAGHWWFDWMGYQGGEHDVAVRVIDAEGRPFAEEQRRLTVRL